MRLKKNMRSPRLAAVRRAMLGCLGLVYLGLRVLCLGTGALYPGVLYPGALSLGAAALRAQPSAAKAANTVLDRRPDRSDVQAVIGMARMADIIPPEFTADALITLVESGLIPDHRMQLDLLKEAFAIAGNAQEKIALKRGSGDSPVTGALHGAFRNGIDQASLRSRAVQAMLRIDKGSYGSTARDLFERIDLPIQPSTGCEQQIVPDLSLYYATMWEVARNIPGRTEIEAFLAAHMPRFVSAAQITPLARVFMQIRDIERMPAVIDAFSSRLADLIEDRRVFSSSFDESIEAIGQLVSSVAPSSRDRLIQQSRAWVLRSVNHGVCAEPPKFMVAFDGAGRKPVVFVEPSERFNQEVAWRSRTANGKNDARIDARINGTEISKRKVGAPAAVFPNSSQYFEYFRTHLLLSRDNEGALDLAQWRIEMERYIARLSEWSWPDQARPTQVVSKIVSYRDASDRSAPDPVVYEPPARGALSVTGQLEGAVTPSYEPRPEGAVKAESAAFASNAPQQDAAASSQPTYPNPADFYLEKSDLLSHVLFIERHAPAAPSSGPVRINWSGAPKPEGPRVEIPGRDRVFTALVDLFDSDTARHVYEDRRLVWFSPVRDLLGTYDRSGDTLAIAELYAASHHPVLSLYGRLAKLVAAR